MGRRPDTVRQQPLVSEDSSRPEIGEPALVGPDGRLYTIAEEPFPQIRRYDVQITEGTGG